ncbi:hypothetical protein C8R43DRAFT_681707 [Mycena crocata]|nr:hypothetical protein C8R43DRAFT_681707 [Mycena crocata]
MDLSEIATEVVTLALALWICWICFALCWALVLAIFDLAMRLLKDVADAMKNEPLFKLMKVTFKLVKVILMLVQVIFKVVKDIVQFVFFTPDLDDPLRELVDQAKNTVHNAISVPPAPADENVHPEDSSAGRFSWQHFFFSLDDSALLSISFLLIFSILAVCLWWVAISSAHLNAEHAPPIPAQPPGELKIHVLVDVQETAKAESVHPPQQVLNPTAAPHPSLGPPHINHGAGSTSALNPAAAPFLPPRNKPGPAAKALNPAAPPFLPPCSKLAPDPNPALNPAAAPFLPPCSKLGAASTTSLNPTAAPFVPPRNNFAAPSSPVVPPLQPSSASNVPVPTPPLIETLAPSASQPLAQSATQLLAPSDSDAQPDSPPSPFPTTPPFASPEITCASTPRAESAPLVPRTAQVARRLLQLGVAQVASEAELRVVNKWARGPVVRPADPHLWELYMQEKENREIESLDVPELQEKTRMWRGSRWGA